MRTLRSSRLFGLPVLLVLQGITFSDATYAAGTFTPIAEASPTLAPFQHVRFCLRYPDECAPHSAKTERITLSSTSFELIKHVNQSVNASIAPIVKQYGKNLDDSWKIAPTAGDCNDYAVTKRHQLLGEGFPSSALRLSAVRTDSGIGHMVLVIVTSKGDLVLDNMTDAIRSWQDTPYQWLKIQSTADSRFWNDIKAPTAVQSSLRAELKVANR